jgi:hypothetical protein
MPDLSVRIAKPFGGFRNERLYAIWETVAEFWKDHLRLGLTPNVGARWSHAQMFNKMWREELQQPEPYVLLTEADFLPNLDEPWWYSNPEAIFKTLDAKHGQVFAALACEYCTRDPRTRALKRRDLPGGWWVLIDKNRFNDTIDFHGVPDPCNQLEAAIGGVYLCEGADAYPDHYGIWYPYGEHLFWSRHLHDNPDRRVSGFKLGDIQSAHDRTVEGFLRGAPEGFREIFESRHASFL